MEKINIHAKLAKFDEHWSPKVVAELNGQQVKLVKMKGEFVWHRHEAEDEMFYVLKGNFTMELRDRSILIQENEFIVIPRGVEHRPVAEQEVSIMLFEPKGTLNTGDSSSELTKQDLEWV
jgi:mannose-6-phosphate isomerase-like protein (cupin superfamily)